MQEIETERLTVRPIAESDWEAIHQQHFQKCQDMKGSGSMAREKAIDPFLPGGQFRTAQPLIYSHSQHNTA